MSIRAQNAATTPIPVQLSAMEFDAFLFPHLSMPKRGPRCKLGSQPLLLPAGGLGPLAVLFFAIVIVVMNLLVDLSYAWLDPRIRYS